MLVKKHVLNNGIEVKDAYLVFNRASVFSHQLTINDTSKEIVNIEAEFRVYLNENAFIEKKEYLEITNTILEYDHSKELIDQIYATLS
ncbi:hypothetical protein [Acinetobacter ursingii]|uniref:hypothetical protein n=1 Tax=Acinetobacter ursingii TaxID=108980 RepID=UPI000F6C5F3C|nr:hypothetical protein [Acinetobacter ursingii]BBF79283.1 hypothetical protein URS_3321 [Acinetobacter ursingii]